MPPIKARQAKLLKSIMGNVIALFEDSPSAATDDWPNQWCDLIDQVRNEHSTIWDLYEQAMNLKISTELSRLSKQEIELLWRLTDEGTDYEFDVEWRRQHGHAMDGDEPEEGKLEKPAADEQTELVVELVSRLILSVADSVELDAAIKQGKKKQRQRITARFLNETI